MKKLYSFLLCTIAVLPFARAYSQTVHQVVASNSGGIFTFTPNNFTAALGDTILFTFGNPPVTPGGFAHTTTSLTIPTGALAWDSPLNTTVMFFKYVVKVPGIYNYKCTPHLSNNMVGSFTVSSVAPVKLMNFSASTVSGNVQLVWQTASEENSDRFSVQMSYDGLNFKDVGTTPAAGNSNNIMKYSYTVTSIVANTPYLYFRLLTIDKDLKQQYSDIILLHYGKVAGKGLIKTFYPNPAENGDHLYFSFDSDFEGKMQLNLFDPSGRKLYAVQVTANKGVNPSHFPLPKLRKGAYFIQFELGERKQTMPLFVK